MGAVHSSAFLCTAFGAWTTRATSRRQLLHNADKSLSQSPVVTFITRGEAPMIGSIAALLILQLVGTIVIRLTGIPLPGPVVGMLLLFLYLLWRGTTPQPLEATTRGLLANLGLLFVPAGVGIITHLNAVADQWLALVVTLVASAVIAIVVTAFALRLLMGGGRDGMQRTSSDDGT